MKLNLRLSRIFSKKQDYQDNKGPRNCTEMKIGNFVSVICQKEEQPFFWEDIFSEYIELTENQSNNTILELAKAAKIYTDKYLIISKMCSIALLLQEQAGYEEFNSLIREMTRVRGGKGKITREELRRHVNVGESFKLKANEKNAEIKALTRNTKESTEKDWYDQLSLLGKYQGYRINPQTVSVLEYCVILNSFKKEVAKQQKNGR